MHIYPNTLSEHTRDLHDRQERELYFQWIDYLASEYNLFIHQNGRAGFGAPLPMGGMSLARLRAYLMTDNIGIVDDGPRIMVFTPPLPHDPDDPYARHIPFLHGPNPYACRVLGRNGLKPRCDGVAIIGPRHYFEQALSELRAERAAARDLSSPRAMSKAALRRAECIARELLIPSETPQKP